MSGNTSMSSAVKTVNLVDLFFEAKKRWYLVLAITVLSFLISLFYSWFLSTPLYNSNAKIYILNKQSQTINSSDISVSTYLANDFAEILLDDVILDKVSTKLDGKYTASQLRSFLSVTNPKNTRIISVTASTPDAKDSKEIVDNVCSTAQETLIEIMGLDKIEIIRSGKIANSPSSPNIQKNAIFGLGFGLVLSALVVFLFYYTNNKIFSSEDVEKYLGLKVLASIPYNEHKKPNF